MENIKCHNKNHNEIKAITFCKECNVYMCNKCQNFHSELFQNHHQSKIDQNINEIFTGFCLEKDHISKLEYFCITHNQLCCSSCITKIKGNGNGQHTDSDICHINDIKQSKKDKLKENIKYLEELSNNFQQSINELKILYEKININKEELKLNIQKIFTKIRNDLNSREDEILLEVDNIFNKLYFNESIIKKGEKLTNQIKINLNKGKIIDNEWNDNSKLNSLIYGCINVENNIKDINEINDKIQKGKSPDTEVRFISDDEINKFIEMIKSFGKIICINKNNNEDLFGNILKESNIIKNGEQIVMLKSWLPYLKKDIIKCKLIYDAKRDGDKAENFHSLCDNKESTLTIISTSDNQIIGGFLSKSFGGNKGWISDKDAFLFSLNYNEKYPSLNQGCNYKDQKDKGPIFGNVCIYISDNFLIRKDNYYKSYTCRYDFGQRSKEKCSHFTVLDLEVYQINE